MRACVCEYVCVCVTLYVNMYKDHADNVTMISQVVIVQGLRQ